MDFLLGFFLFGKAGLCHLLLLLQAIDLISQCVVVFLVLCALDESLLEFVQSHLNCVRRQGISQSDGLGEVFAELMKYALFVFNELVDSIVAVDTFLPYVDNWAVCDIMSPKIFKKNKTALLEKIKGWSASERTYTCRFGIEMLMSHFLDDDFTPEYLEIPVSVQSEEYYVQMMIAWFFATALAKQWDATIKYLEDHRLDAWTHNKAIQKARESKRITPQEKDYVKSLKR